MSLSATHFEDHDWEEVLDQAEQPICRHYARLFAGRKEEAEEEGNAEAEALYGALCSITALHLSLEAEEAPLTGVGEVSEERLLVLAEVFPSIAGPELRARLGDILWLRRIGDNPYQFALEAIDAYLESARELEGFNHSQPTRKRYARAAELAVQLNHDDKKEDVEAALQERIRSRASTETEWWTLWYSKILFVNDLGEPAEQGLLIEQAAESIEDSDVDSGIDYWKSRRYWELAAEWHHGAGDADAARAARIEAAERFARLAEQAPKRMNAFSHYRSAYKAYRTIDGAEERQEELHRLMLDAGEESRREMVQFSRDPTNEAQQDQARDHVKSVRLEETLTDFALGYAPPSEDHYRKRVREEAQINPLKAIIPGELHNAMGHVIGTKAGGFEDEEGALHYLMHEVASETRHKVAVNYIRPAKAQMLEDHYIGRHAIADFLKYSTFIPGRRLHAFTKGLHAGFRNDFLTAAHILAPQIESALRRLLELRDIITTGLDRYNIQHQRPLGKLLREEPYRNGLVNLLGENLVFDLTGLMVEAAGANIRNDVAHGLNDDGAYWNMQVIYMWWMTLHLAAIFIPADEHAVEET